MIGLILKTLFGAAGLWLASKVIKGISYDTTTTLIIAALLLGLVNAFIRPILVFLTFPVTLLTLGLFLLVINGLMLMLVGALLKGFQVQGLIAAILGSIVVSVVVWVGSKFIDG